MQGRDEVLECTAAAAAIIYSLVVVTGLFTLHDLSVFVSVEHVVWNTCMSIYTCFIYVIYVETDMKTLFDPSLCLCWSGLLSYRISPFFLSSGENKVSFCSPNPSSRDLEKQETEEERLLDTIQFTKMVVIYLSYKEENLIFI